MDEGWKLLMFPRAQIMIEEYYRTMRKNNGAIYFITQQPEDLKKSLIAGAILASTDIKYILRTTYGADEYSFFDITDKEISLIENLDQQTQYRDIFIKYTKYSRVIRLKPSSIDYWICTTDPFDMQKETAFREEHPEYSNADIIKGLAEKYPR
jgi:type IV secretory pathway VirB4 component